MKFGNLLQKPRSCQGDLIPKKGLNPFLFNMFRYPVMFRYPAGLEVRPRILRAKESVMPAM